jgi:hypothetical protein
MEALKETKAKKERFKSISSLQQEIFNPKDTVKIQIAENEPQIRTPLHFSKHFELVDKKKGMFFDRRHEGSQEEGKTLNN